MGDILQFPGNRIKKEIPENNNPPPVIIDYMIPCCSNEGTHQRVVKIRIQVMEIMNSSEESADFSMRENGFLVYDVIIDTLDEPITNIDLDAVEFLLALIFIDEHNEVFSIFAERLYTG